MTKMVYYYKIIVQIVLLFIFQTMNSIGIYLVFYEKTVVRCERKTVEN